MYKVKLSCKQCSCLHSAQVASVVHVPFGKEILACFLPVLFLQEWRMISARIYIYLSTQQLSIWRKIIENASKIF